MTRTVSSTITSAVGKDVTQPIYLIHITWDATSPIVHSYVATWDTAITWNSITWSGSGVRVVRLSNSGGQLQLPNGDTDPWLTLVTNQNPQGKAIEIYEHHTDATASPQTDAALIFSGVLDGCIVTEQDISIDFISDLTNKSFPVSSIDSSVFTHLLRPGSRMYWGPDIVLVR